MAATFDEDTRPGTPGAKRDSRELAAVRAENLSLRDRLAKAEREIKFLEKRHEALVGRVQLVENSLR